MALEGIRVLDLTWGGAGPFATKALADHGADVIKVETSTHYDFPRTTGPYAEGKKGINRSTYFSNRNTSKRGITLNFKKPKAIELAKRLVRSCDLVVNNFRAGVMERMGLGYQDLALCHCLRQPLFVGSRSIEKLLDRERRVDQRDQPQPVRRRRQQHG